MLQSIVPKVTMRVTLGA